MSEAYVRVAVRIRPLLPRELLHRHQVCVRAVPGSAQLEFGTGRLFSFDHVFGPAASQDEVYVSCVQHLVESVVEGYNATVFCYGQTGSGKTYTLGGRNPELLPDEDGGIIDRVVRDLFLLVENKRESDNATTVTVRASYLELYNDELRDLLELPTIHKDLHIREDERRNTVVVGGKEVAVASAEELFSVIEMGNALRHTAGTGINQHSSRSHAILTLQVTLSYHNKKSSSLTSVRSSKLCLVDLAGSERATKTGNTGIRLKESCHINSDLLALGNVIRCLSDPSRNRPNSCGGLHIPFRDSKLTRLLRESLGGTAHTLMVACVSPSHNFIVETLSVLQFASKARHIRNCPGPIALQTEIKSESIAGHPNDVRLGELEYELRTLRQLLKEKEKEVELEKEKITEKGTIVRQSSLLDVSEPDKVTVQEERSQYRLLAQEAAVLLEEISGSSSDLFVRQRVQKWQERLTAVTHSHEAVKGSLEMSGAHKLDELQEPCHREKQQLEKKEVGMRLALKEVEKLVQERKTYLEALEEEKQRIRIQTEQLVTQQIVIDRLRSDLMTFGGKSSSTTVAADASGGSEKRPYSVPLITHGSCTSPRKIHSSPPADSLERVMAAFKIRGQLLQAEVDEKQEVFCPYIQQWTESKNGNPVIKEDDEKNDFHVNKRRLWPSLNQTWTSQDRKSAQEAENPEENQARHPVIQETPEATGTQDNQTTQSRTKKARVQAVVIQRRIQDLSVNMRMKEELIKKLDKTEKQIQAVDRQGSHSVDDGEVSLLASLSVQNQQVRREMYHSLQHMMRQKAKLQTSLQQQRETSDGSKTLHSNEGCVKDAYESSQKEESNEQLPERSWLEEEEEQVLQKRVELQQLEEELRKREEVLLHREACLQQKAKLEMKILRSSQVQNRDFLHVSMQLESLEQQLQRDREGGATIEELKKKRDALKKQRDNLNDQLRDNRVLTIEEEHRLHQLEEDIEALDAEVEFKNSTIWEKERNLAALESSLHQSQSAEPAQLSGVNKKLRELSQPEACELLIKYFNKAVCLRETVRHLHLRCQELELQAREQDEVVREMATTMQRMTLDTDRRLTEQHRSYLNTVQLLLHKVKEGVSREALQAIQEKLKQLEKELFFYKSSSRKLKKNLSEVLEKASDSHSQSAQIQDHRQTQSKHGSINVPKSHTEEALPKTPVATSYTEVQAEETDYNTHENKHAQHTQPPFSSAAFGTTKAPEGSPIQSGPQERKAGGHQEESVQLIQVRVSRRKLREIPAPGQVTSLATRRPQSSVDSSTKTITEDSIEVSRDI